MNFAPRPASQTWEPIPFAGGSVWAWFWPPNVPHGIILRVPDEAFQSDAVRGHLTLRNLLAAVGIDPLAVAQCFLHGELHEGAAGTAAVFDRIIAPPLPDVDPNIVVSIAPQHFAPQPYAVPQQYAAPAPPPAGPATMPGDAAATLAAIDVEWQSILRLEVQTSTVRKQLGEMIQRLKSLNRDLSPDERIYASRADKTEWETARRWLRDLAIRVSKCIKDHDIGETSIAGKRLMFQNVYDQFVAAGIPFEGVEQAQREFETHRKQLQTLLTAMQQVHMTAQQDGERRAQQVLQRIAVSVRTGRR